MGKGALGVSGLMHGQRGTELCGIFLQSKLMVVQQREGGNLLLGCLLSGMHYSTFCRSWCGQTCFASCKEVTKNGNLSNILGMSDE